MRAARVGLTAIALAMSTVLAGCTADQVQQDPDDGGSLTPPTGSGSPEDTEDTEGKPSGADEGGPTITWFNESLDAYLTTPVYRVSGTDIGHLEPAPGANVTGYVIEVSWTPANLYETELALWVRGHTLPSVTGTIADSMLDPDPLVKVEGPSPLVVALPRSDLTDEAGYSVFLRAAGPVGFNPGGTPFVSSIATFDGIPFDPAWRSMR